MPDDRYILASDAKSVYDSWTGKTWTAREIMDTIFDRKPPQPPPITRDELAIAMDQAARADPWADLVDDHRLRHWSGIH